MKNLHLAHAGLNKPIKAVKISQDGTLREVKGVYISHHGRWAKVYENFFEITHTLGHRRLRENISFYNNFNMRTWLLAQGWDGEASVRVTLTIPDFVPLDNPIRVRHGQFWSERTRLELIITSSSENKASFVGGGPYPDGSSITVNVDGKIAGAWWQNRWRMKWRSRVPVMDLSREIRNKDGSNQWTVVIKPERPYYNPNNGAILHWDGGGAIKALLGDWNEFPPNSTVSLAGRHVTLRNYHRSNIYGTTAEPFIRPKEVWVRSRPGLQRGAREPVFVWPPDYAVLPDNRSF